MNRNNSPTYFVYMIQCDDGSLYTGITTDIERRFSEHKNGKGGHYTASHRARKILYTEKHGTKGGALKREAEIKRWRRKKKMELVSGIIRS